MPSWDRLAQRTTLLTTLSLDIRESSPEPPPTIPQLLSILISNPNLQELLMTGYAIPEDGGVKAASQAPLRCLKKLHLTGNFRCVFRLLDRLVLPDTLDYMSLTLLDSTVERLSQVLRPYLGDYLQRNHRLQNRLGIDARSTRNYLSIRADTIGEPYLWTPFQRVSLPSVTFKAVLDGVTPADVLDNLCLDLIASAPRMYVVTLNTCLPTHRMEDLLVTVPNVETLYLSNAVLSRGFLQPNPDGPRANTKFLPSLQSLHLEDVTLGDGSWEPLVTYLTHQTSGNQIISLQASSSSRMCPEVANEIKGLVGEFSYVEDLETESKGLWDRDRPERGDEDEDDGYYYYEEGEGLLWSHDLSERGGEEGDGDHYHEDDKDGDRW